MKGDSSSESGFGLMESLVALAIIAFALPAFYKAMSTAYKASSQVKLHEAALGVSRTKLDALVTQDLLEQGTTDGAYGNGLLWRLSVLAISRNQAAPANGKRPYWLVLETFDRAGRPLLKLETIKLMSDKQ